MNNTTTLDVPIRQTTAQEYIIYPTGSAGAFACDSPDGYELCDGQELDVLLGGHWITGHIEHRPHTASRFIARDGQSLCGLSAEMKIRI